MEGGPIGSPRWSRRPTATIRGRRAGRPRRQQAQRAEPILPGAGRRGINTYGGIVTLPEVVARQGSNPAWLVTEFGPRGHWEVPKRAWGLPIEDSSAEKAGPLPEGLSRRESPKSWVPGLLCVPLGQKQEKTHTWYGMFLREGNRLARSTR